MVHGTGSGSPLLWMLSGGGRGPLAARARRLRDHLRRQEDWHPVEVGRALVESGFAGTAFADPAPAGTAVVGSACVGAPCAGSARIGWRRAALVAEDRAGFLDLLDALADGRGAPGLTEGEGEGGAGGENQSGGGVPGAGAASDARASAGNGRGPVFVYPGQGAQWPGMAARLLETSPVFRRRMDDCAAALEPFTDWSLVDLLRGAPGSPSLGRADVVQPVLFAMTLSLTELWRSYGVEPGAVLGHSVGEITSAAVADALSLDDAARVVALWSQAQATLAGRGEMVSVMAAAEDLAPRLERWSGRLAVAAVNGPRSVIVSGDADAAEELLTDLERAGVHARKVAVGLAAHSAHIDEIVPRMRTDLAPIRPRPARLPYYSALTGGLLEAPALDADYWCRNLRQTVRFEEATRAALADGYRTLLEVSPHTVLTSAMQATAEESGVDAHVMGTLRRDQGDRKRFLISLGELCVHGVEPDWRAVYAEDDRRGENAADHADSEAVRTRQLRELRELRKLRELLETLEAQEVQKAREPQEALEVLGPDGGGADLAYRVEGAADAPGSALRAELAALPAAGRRAALLKLVAREVAGLLGRPGPVPADEPFLDLGFDSVTAVELRNRLGAATGLPIPATAVFDHPTPGALADALGAELTGDRTEAETEAEAEDDDETGGIKDAAADDDPVVIVGMGCRYPGGAGTPDDLWRLVADGTDAVTPFPTDRGWDTAAHYDPEQGRPGRYYQREAGFLHEAADFDARFFGISPREALAMDPQQRLLLETGWEVFERAGIDPTSLRASRTGVFIGAMTMDYGPRLQDGAEVGGHLLTGNTGSVASGRLAYALGLEGAAITVDTACSSSLVALHLAARAVRSGECSMALAGGATVMSTVGMFVEFSRQGGLAPDGRCKAFAAGADGFGLAEGVGMLLLERLSDARRAGHPVLAVVRGSAVNQDGASNGLTAPNGPSQQRVIRAALTDAGLRAADVDLVEAHGTGTRLGDPIEAQALLATYGQNRPAQRPLMLGSLKSNIGHTQAAAGVGGVIKTVLAMRHAIMPKTLHVDGATPSPEVDWSAGAVELLTEARPWEAVDRPRRAGVSSFGVSGTNAHVILEEAPPAPEETAGRVAPGMGTGMGTESDGAPYRSPVLAWPLSAKSEQALREQAHRLLEAQAELSEEASATASAADTVPPSRLADVGYSLATGRAAHQHRAVLIGTDAEDFRQALTALAAGSAAPGLVQGPVGAGGEVAFVFPGQGSQWVGMAAQLLDSEPVFADRVAECGRALAPFVDWSLDDVLRAGVGAPSLERVDVVQPALFAVMVSLAAVWRSYGVEPGAVVGHSQGEIAAACVAGALSLEDAARVVALRSKALRVLSGRGGMVSVALPAGEVGEWLAGEWGGELSVAAVNGPASTVVSGDAGALDALLVRAEERGVRARRVPVDYASHCAHVEDIYEQLLSELNELTTRQADVPFYSTVTGGLLDATVLDAEYWYRNLRQTVRFEEATRALLAEGFRCFVEPSAHPVLTVGVQESAEAAGVEAVVLGTLRRDEGGRDRLLLALGQAWASGLPVDFSGTYPGARRVELPTYPFQRERFWLEAPPPAAPVASSAAAADDLFEGLEREDPARLSQTLGVSLEALGEVLPALAAWRSVRSRERRADSWRYHVGWRPVPVPIPASPGVPLTGRWLAVVPQQSEPSGPAGGHASDAVAAVLAALTAAGVGLAVVTATGPGATREELSAALSEAVSAASAASAATAATTASAVDGAGVEGGDGADKADDREPVAGVLSFLAWEERVHPEHPGLPGALALTLALAQALGDAGVEAPLWLLTSGTAVVGGAERPGAPAHAAVAALGRTVALEHPQRWGGLIDLPAAALDERAARRLCAVLAGAAAADEEQVAVRSTGVHGRRLLAAPPRPYETAGRWESGGTVLVTGGTGGVGACTARRLAEQGVERLLLVSRRGPDAPGAGELCAELAELGVEASVVACDIADREALAALVAGIPDEAPLTGVFHAAGVLDDGLLDALTPARLAVSLRAKLTAAQNLHEVTAGLDLSAFVVFSSVMGVVGNAGQGNYAAANAAMDALVALRRADGLPGTSIAWGAWAVTGMLDGEVAARLRDAGMPVMEPDTAVTAIGRAMAEDDGLVLVADVDWRRYAAGTGLRSGALLAELPDPRPGTGAGGESAATGVPGAGDGTGGQDGSVRARLAALTSAQDRIQCVTDLVRTHTAAVLRHRTADAVRPAEAFAALGLDSLTAVELRNRLGGATGLKLPATVVFDHPTPGALAERLLSELSEAVGAAVAPTEPATEDARAHARPYSSRDDDDDPIAIVGMGCRFPGGVERPEQFWDLLAEGVDAVGDWPLDRGWDTEGLYDPDPDHPGTTYSDQGAFIADVSGFDAEFFGISPREALAMDPQQRLLLETSWEAIERAGQDPSALRGRQVGVFFGTNGQDYLAQLEGSPGASEGHFLTGNTASVLSGRVSYTLGLEGPSLTLDTACSSSLVALHLAVQALRRGDCEQALAGGVTVMSTPKLFVEFSRQRGLAPDGRCKAFSADADGTGWGEGAGVLLLERLSAARRHGHPVLALVSGVAVNQDGASNGLSAPNGPAQQNVIRAALADAGLRPEQIDAVEAHGTGTTLGDPIEAQALQAVYGARRAAGRPLWLGSVKSNIGHTQAAAGVAGVMKMVLALGHGELPSTLHLGEPNPHVDWSAGTIRLLAERTPWPESDGPRRAGVSSFGISGTNAHVVLEQAPEGTDGSAGRGTPAGTEGPRPLPVPLLLSAATGPALRAQAERLHAHLAAHPDTDLADVAYSLASGRAALEHRAAVLGTEPESVLRSLRAYAEGRRPASVLTGTAGLPGRTAFLFPGQGSQRAGAGARLYRDDAVFADALDEVLTELDPHLEVPLHDVLFAENGTPEAELLERTRYTQPALFALETALFRLVRHWGVRPDLLMGHSIGELAAAHAAGVLDLRDACALVAARGRLMDALPEGGAMVAIEAEEAEVRSAVGDEQSSGLVAADIAAVNGPDSTVVSGDTEAVLRLAEAFRARGRRTKRLAVSHAFHSARMDGMLDEFRRVAEGLTYSAPRIAVVSNLTGEPATAEELCSPDYWVRHVRGTVRFLDGARRLRAEGATTFLELGPGGVLSGMLHGCLADADGCETLPVLREGRPETAAVRGALAGLHVRGVPVDWTAGWRGVDVRRVGLPTYAFQHKRFWPQPSEPAPTPVAGRASDELWDLLDGPDGVRAFAAELGLGEGATLQDVPGALASRRSRRAADAAAERLRYRVGWQPLAVPPAPDLPGTWLLVVPEDGATGSAGPGCAGLALACEEALVRHGAEVSVLRVAAGTGRAELAGLLPADRSDVVGVLSLLAFADAEAHADAHADVEDGRSAFGSDAPSAPLAATLTLIQALGDRELNAPLWCVTSGAVAPVGPDAASAHVATAPEAPVLPDGSAVGPYEPALTDSAPTDSVPIDPVQAQIWGLGRVAALELPRLWGGLIDLTGALDGGELEDGALDGMCAVLGGADGEDQVAVRGARLFGRRLDRASVPARPAAEVWKPRGTVLITGGTGGLGAHVARKLAAEGAEHLVLLSRRGPRSPGAAELTAELSALGARSTVLACDVADRAALTRVLDGLRAEQETVRAVVHTAGLTSDTRIEHCTPDGVARETAAKTRGADHLDALFDSPSLDAFVLFSSISATWGSGGQAAYAAANAHLDALAAARCARGLAATSVAWGPWSGAGMAHGDVGRRLRRHGLVPMEPAAALDALQRALTYGESELVVADMDWQGFLPAFLSARDSALLRRLPDAAPAATAGPDAEGPAESGADAHDAWRRALAELPPDERGHRLRELVRAEAAEVLGHDSTGSIDADRPFRDAGFDSLTAVELRNRLIAVTGLALPLTTVFDHPTATALGDHLLAELTVAELTGGERDGAGLASAGPQGAGSGGAARWLSTSAATPVSVDSAASAAFDAAAIPDGPDAPAAPAGEPLAIVSMACRFPGGVRSPEGLWRLVADGVDAIGDFPADRGWPLAELYDPDPERQGTFYATGGGFLDGAGEFDAEFFGVSPREALAMDPQQRLLLETGWEALERAGIDPETVRGGQGGVYIGVASQGYGTGAQDPAADVEGHLLSGTVTSVASGRISYILGLEGPAVTVETACSSSLVALHLAGQALRSGDCSFALVGGAAVMASPDVFVEFSRQQGLSPDGRCRSFAQSANGTGWGEGVGVLLVERLSDARRLGHPVLALVRGTAVNQDGASNGLTAPSGPAQQRAITAALAGAGLRPEQIDLVEAHGTGTTLGDPIEAQALLATYGQNRPQRRPLWLGSLKSNIGHTQAAAGVAGVIKTVMALRHGVLPRTLHAEEASRRVDWSTGAVRLLSDPRPWDTGDEPRRAGVSAFGMSGTNAHAILEQAPEAAPLPHHHAAPSPRGAAAAPASHGADDVDGPEAPGAGGRDALGAVTVVEAAPSAGATEEPGFTGPTGPASVGASPVPWLLSARTPGALRRQARQLAVWLEEDSGLGPADVAVALATTRTAFSCRAAAVGTGRGELLDWLGAVAEGEVLTSAGRGRGKGGRTAFVFPGQGSQWVGMGSELLGREAVFTAAIERCAAALAPHTDWSLTRVLRNEPDAPSLDRVDVVQPTLFAVMVALAEYWRAIGVRADAVVGHSQGEIAAACVAGALSLPDAAMVVALRSKALLRIAGRGGMVSVAASEERVRELLADGDGSCVAAVNGPDAVVVAGEPDGLDALLSACERDGLRARRIPVDYAAHSAQVAEIKDELLKSLAGVRPRSCVVPMYSAVTGGPIDGTLLNADYWYRNLREPVDFAGATGALLVAGHDLLIEVSPHPVLLAGAERVAEAAGRTVTGVGTLRRDDGGPDRLLASSAEAWAAGAPLDRRALLPEDAEARPVTLPTYPFQRDRYWLPTPGRSGALALAERAPATTPDLTAEATTPGLSAAANATGLTAEANATGLAATAGSADLAAASDTADLGVAAPGANASPEHASAADEADEVESPAARLAARLASLDEPGRRQAVLDLVTRHAAAVLGHPGAGAVPPDRAFSDVGFDSMLAMRFRSRLCTATGLSIPPTVVFEHPTPAALADHLHDELSAAVPAPVRLTELDDLAAKLAALTPGAPGTEEIGDRLTDLLRDWTRRVDPAGSAAANGLTGHTSPTAPNGSTAPARPTDPTGRPADAPAGHPADEAAPVAAPDPASADAMATASADELFALLDDNFGMA